jgi:N6-L-threonylcarbamoyladenine synthase
MVLEKVLKEAKIKEENFKKKIDVIAVTTGPGLEPALWTGIVFAKELNQKYKIPIIPVNHMEGHIFSIFPKNKKTFTIENKKENFPMLTLLVSGGHTELVLIKDFQKYKKIGQTRDDAAGEAFDKVARMLGLSYPGGPEISKLANTERSSELYKFLGPQISSPTKTSLKMEVRPDHKNSNNSLIYINLPRPMIYSKNYDFSFSGLKTAVLYLIRDLKEKKPNILDDIKIKQKIAREFEDSVIETLTYKTIKAIKEYKIKTLIVGGGVSANSYLQKTIKDEIKKNKLKTKTFFPIKSLTGDNALMIAIAGYYQKNNKKKIKNINLLKAEGNLSL